MLKIDETFETYKRNIDRSLITYVDICSVMTTSHAPIVIADGIEHVAISRLTICVRDVA